jgi:hypothetical protein
MKDVMKPAVSMMTEDDTRTIVDAIYLAWALIHRDKKVLDPFDGTLSLERLNSVFAGLTCEELGE